MNEGKTTQPKDRISKSRTPHIPARARVLAAILLLASVIFISGAAKVSASPEELGDEKYVLLNDPGYLDFLSGNMIRSLEFGYEDGVGFARINFVLSGTDPFIYMPISSISGGVNCDEYKYVAISVRSPYPTKCNLYFGTSVEGSLDESKNIPSRIGISNSPDWETVVFYCGDNYKWTGTLTNARFDPYAGVPEGMEYMDIRWIAFVKEESDLEKLDVSLDQMQNADLYTRMPVYSTPDRTKPPENTFRPSSGNAVISDKNNEQRGFSPAVLIIVSSILLLSISAAAVGIAVLKKKEKKGKG